MTSLTYTAIKAVVNGNINELIGYVNNGFDVRYNNDYLLCLACEKGHLDMVKYLVENGCAIDNRDFYPMDAAITGEHLHIVTYLSNIVDKNDSRLAKFNERIISMYDTIYSFLMKVVGNSNNLFKDFNIPQMSINAVTSSSSLIPVSILPITDILEDGRNEVMKKEYAVELERVKGEVNEIKKDVDLLKNKTIDQPTSFAAQFQARANAYNRTSQPVSQPLENNVNGESKNNVSGITQPKTSSLFPQSAFLSTQAKTSGMQNNGFQPRNNFFSGNGTSSVFQNNASNAITKQKSVFENSSFQSNGFQSNGSSVNKTWFGRKN